MRSIIAAIFTVFFVVGVVCAQMGSTDGSTMTSTGTSSGISSSTTTQQGGATGGASTDQMSQQKTITATVANVNSDQKKITITGSQGQKVEYVLNDSTVITGPNGETMRVGDLKPGTMISITYTGTADNANVQRVTVQRGQ